MVFIRGKWREGARHIGILLLPHTKIPDSQEASWHLSEVILFEQFRHSGPLSPGNDGDPPKPKFPDVSLASRPC